MSFKKKKKIERKARGGPIVELNLDNVVYRLTFDFRAVADAEEAVNESRVGAGRVNLLVGMLMMTAATVPPLFWAALSTHHPEITLDDAGALVSPENVIQVVNALSKVYCLAEPEAVES